MTEPLYCLSMRFPDLLRAVQFGRLALDFRFVHRAHVRPPRRVSDPPTFSLMLVLTPDATADELASVSQLAESRGATP